MSIDLSDNNPRIEYSVAQGVTQTSFAIPFEFFDDSDVNIYVDGTLKTEGVDYTLTGGDGSTGTASISVTGATGGSIVIILRSIALERVTDFTAGADINRAALNQQLDSLVAIAADLDNRIDRSFKISVTETGDPKTSLLTDIQPNSLLGFDGTGQATQFPVDSFADITGVIAGSGLTGGGTSGDVTVSHDDTSSQASVDNSGGTVIQDVTLDTFGHVTGLTSYNLDGRYYTETEADSRFVNTSGDTMSGNLTFGDGDKAVFGESSDLQIYHDGSNSFVKDAGTGNLILQGDNSVQLRSVTGNQAYFFGAYGGASYIYHAGSAKLATTSTGIDVTGTVVSDGLTSSEPITVSRNADNMLVFDNTGASDDWTIKVVDTDDTMRFTWGASDFYLFESDGQLNSGYSVVTRSKADARYLQLSGGELTGNLGVLGNIALTGTVTADGADINAGSTYSASTQTIAEFRGGDNSNSTYGAIEVGHSASQRGLKISGGRGAAVGDGYISVIDNSGTAVDAIRIQQGGDISFYEDTGTTAQMVWDASADALTFGDGVKAIFGAGSDLQIYHDGSNSRIYDLGTGDLRLQGTNVRIQSGAGDDFIYAVASGSVTAYYNNSEKLATTNTGVDVTGTVTADGLTVDGDATVQSTSGNDATFLLGQSGVRNWRFRNEATTGYLSIKPEPSKTSLQVAASGDISFYEDTGTTPKFFWDASAEVLETNKISALGDQNTKLDLNIANTARIFTGGLERVRVNSSGNVGIGTSVAQAQLHVQGNAQGADQAIIESTNGGASFGPQLNLKRSSSSPANNDSIGVLTFTGNNSVLSEHTFARVSAQANDVTDGAEDGSIVFSTSNAGSISEVLRIDSSGNVGIGTTSPSKTLDVRSGSFNSSVAQFTGANDGRGLLISTFLRASNDDSVDYDTPFGGHHTFSSSGSEKVRITNTGNVGIGTSSPSCELDVTGTVKASNAVEVGEFGGSVALTLNDGYGNANVTFNHRDGVPDSNGNSLRIETNTDSSTGAYFKFRGASGVTGGVTASLTEFFSMSADGATCYGLITTEGLTSSDPITVSRNADNMLVFDNTGASDDWTIKVVDTDDTLRFTWGAGDIYNFSSGATLPYSSSVVTRGNGDGRYLQLSGGTLTGRTTINTTAKIGTGADGSTNGDELAISKDQLNVGISILSADATGQSRIYFGSQTDTQAAMIRHNEVNDRLFVQAKGDLYFQTGGATTNATLNTAGDFDITGALSKGSGSFKIDHPLKPDTHHLVHSFIEGPQADNIYRGRVTLVDGIATVNLDVAGRMTEGTFVALNGNVQCFTTNEDGWTAVRGSVSGNVLTIEAQDVTCTDTVSWMVIGERHDQHMINTHWTDDTGRVITEPEKAPVEQN